MGRKAHFIRGAYCIYLSGRRKGHAIAYRQEHKRFANDKDYSRIEEMRGRGGGLVKRVRGRELQNQLCRLKNQETREFEEKNRKQERGEVSKDTGGQSIPRIIQPFIRMRKYKEIAGGYAEYLATCRRNEQAGFTITSFGNGCSGEPLAPTVVPLVVTNFGEDPDPLGAGRTHNRRDPSSAVQYRGLFEAGRGTGVDGHRCSAVLDVSGGDERGIAEATRPWSSEVARQSSVRIYSSKGERVLGWVRWASAETEKGRHGYSL